jgi:hypothetical protein
MIRAATGGRVTAAASLKVGLVQVESSLTHSLKAPGFNPCAYEVRTWFSKLASLKFSLYRYIEASAKAAGRPGVGVGGSSGGLGGVRGAGEQGGVDAQAAQARAMVGLYMSNSVYP